jgi:hypothetical protein
VANYLVKCAQSMEKNVIKCKIKKFGAQNKQWHLLFGRNHNIPKTFDFALKNGSQRKKSLHSAALKCICRLVWMANKA